MMSVIGRKFKYYFPFSFRCIEFVQRYDANIEYANLTRVSIDFYVLCTWGLRWAATSRSVVFVGLVYICHLKLQRRTL